MTSVQDLQLASAAFARIRALEERGMPDAAELPEIFADLFADHGGASAVEIMTIHKAKGLEFDMVVLPALDRAVPPDRNQLLLSHQFARTRARRHGDGGPSAGGHRGRSAIRVLALPAARRSRARSATPAVRGLHPRKMPIASDRRHRR